MYPEEIRKQVSAVALDMCDTFYAAVAETIPEATDKIVYDRFHVMQHVSKAVNKVRSQESAQLASRGDERLKGSRFVWLYSSENVPAEQMEWLEQLKADKLQTGRAAYDPISSPALRLLTRRRLTRSLPVILAEWVSGSRA